MLPLLLYPVFIAQARIFLQGILHICVKHPLARFRPVVLTPEEQPFIPGSSFKGALRSAIEKLVPSLPGLRTCGLSTKENENDPLREGKADWCPTAHQAALVRRRRNLSEQDAEKQL